MQFRCDDFPDALNKNKNPSFAYYDYFLLWSAASILCPYMRLWPPLRKHSKLYSSDEMAPEFRIDSYRVSYDPGPILVAIGRGPPMKPGVREAHCD